MIRPLAASAASIAVVALAAACASIPEALQPEEATEAIVQFMVETGLLESA